MKTAHRIRIARRMSLYRRFTAHSRRYRIKQNAEPAERRRDPQRSCHANRLGDAGERPSVPDESCDFCAPALLRASSAISAFSWATLAARQAVEGLRSGPTGILWSLPTAALRAMVLITLASQFVLGQGVAQLNNARLGPARLGQRRARELTGNLISEVLDSQLRRLSENNLSHVPLHAEISSLRRNVGGMLENEMAEIADLLGGTTPLPANAVETNQARARVLARKVVVQLMVERRRIRKRLRVAQTATIVQQLIDLQSAARRKAESLDRGSNSNRDAAAVEVFHDQADVGSLLIQLQGTLEDIAGWAGTLGASATEALQRSRDDRVVAVSDEAKTKLRQGQFSEALPDQQRVLATLYAVHQALGRAQGLASLNRAAALRLTRRLIRMQKKIHDETRLADLSDDSLKDRLAGEQRSLQRELDPLENLMRFSSLTVDDVGRASVAARGAEQTLFEGDLPATLAQQQQVLASLAAVEQLLGGSEAAGSKGNPKDPSNSRLNQLNEAVDRAMQLQSRATELATDRPQEAADVERQVADQLASSQEGQALAEAISRLFDQAEEAVADAQQAFDEAEDRALRQEAARRAEEALSELAAEIKSSLPDESDQDGGSEMSSGGEEAGTGQPTEQSSQSQQESGESGTEPGTPQGDSAGSQDENTMFDSRTKDEQHDAAVQGQRFVDEPWFAKLPPGLQRAIQTRTRRPAPRGYEERLRRYFQSVD
jgi:hypothetical protein